MSVDLNGQSVLVVGAGGGIGAATAEAFTTAGAHVVAAGLPGPKLEAVASRARAKARALDFLDNSAVEAQFAAAEPFDHVAIAAEKSLKRFTKPALCALSADGVLSTGI
jgi:NAD(P)-dependent dehydrogenase (short-subunit alcohol dehydrogenase family)